MKATPVGIANTSGTFTSPQSSSGIKMNPELCSATAISARKKVGFCASIPRSYPGRLGEGKRVSGSVWFRRVVWFGGGRPDFFELDFLHWIKR